MATWPSSAEAKSSRPAGAPDDTTARHARVRAPPGHSKARGGGTRCARARRARCARKEEDRKAEPGYSRGHELRRARPRRCGDENRPQPPLTSTTAAERRRKRRSLTRRSCGLEVGGGGAVELARGGGGGGCSAQRRCALPRREEGRARESGSAGRSEWRGAQRGRQKKACAWRGVRPAATRGGRHRHMAATRRACSAAVETASENGRGVALGRPDARGAGRARARGFTDLLCLKWAEKRGAARERRKAFFKLYFQEIFKY